MSKAETFRLLQYFGRQMGLYSQVVVAIALVICLSMATLGYWVNAYIGEVEVESAADADAVYMNIILEPLLRGVERHGTVPPEVEAQLDLLLDRYAQDSDIEAAAIWWQDGTVAYSTDKRLMGRRMSSAQLDAAFAGRVVAEMMQNLTDHGSRRQARMGQPLLEVYVPLRAAETGAVTAVGEFYRNAAELQAQMQRVAARIWGVVGLTTALMLVLLLLTATRARRIVRAQQDELHRRLTISQQLARQNADLRQAAETAKLDAIKANEDLLNRIGADLHDGPLQLLGLIVLRLSGLSPGQAEDAAAAREREKTAELAARTMQELRHLAYGLSIPELEGLTVPEALSLAISRHESQTGTAVARQWGDLPEQLSDPAKTCLYRIVQESLNNAFRHAGGKGQRVRAAMRDGEVELTIGDAGPGLPPESRQGDKGDNGQPGLGLPGLARRLQTLGGRLEVASQPGQGTTVTARLPVEAEARLLHIGG
ncbi:sensor histidine kinase [Paracoccus sp. MKU1]|uniref:sensor histidine kinase n=1 Tax=Paracoccus sp. MKU1 TaxID=1745182 RepID=UPI00137B5C31|nr:ATP-binding protein [Paracoccus sp. MKU1]